MRKLFLGSIALTLFSISIFLFQMSCKKETSAQTSSTKSQLNLILYAVDLSGGLRNSGSVEYWTMNYDGTNAKKIPITFTPLYQYSMNPRLSPDGKTIFFSATSQASANYYTSYLYCCSIDGTNLKTLLVQNPNNGTGADIEVSGAY